MTKGVIHNSKIKVHNVFLVVFLAIFIVSAWRVYSIYREYKAGANSYASIEQYVSFEQTVPTERQDEESVSSQTEPTEAIQYDNDDILWPNVDFEALSEINADVVGWLYIEGTGINYPIVQGLDNDFYLRHLFDGNYNSAGCIFLDAVNKSDFSEKNNIVYGHHMKDGTMFHDLMGYKTQSFYNGHTIAMLVTPSSKYKIHFFSAYVASAYDSAWNVDFSDVGYEQWLQELQNKSCIVSEFHPTAEDRVITLSTCTYEFNNARFVLHGVLTEYSY